MQQIIDAAMNKARINAQGQVQAANAAAQGQIGSAKMASEGNVLGNIWSQPANFGSIMGDIYGNYAGNTGAQGANYANAYGGLSAGLSGLGNSSSANYGAYTAGLNNAGNNYGAQANANSNAEAARQAAVGNIGSAALGAYGGGINAALGAYGLQQQAYNLAMGQAANANQGAVSSLGQSRNNALAGLGNAYAALGGSAAQLGGAGLNASQASRTDNYQDQIARNNQITRSTSTDQANMYGGGSGDYSGGYGYGGGNQFVAGGPDGTIASGSYGSPGGSASGAGSNYYDMGGTRNAQSDSYGSNDSYARQTNRATQVTGPQMDAFRASLGAGMAGIGGALGGLNAARGDVMNNDYLSALQSANSGAVRALGDANAAAGGRIEGFLDQGLSGLLRLGGQGYNNSRKGMDQYYANAGQVADNQNSILGLLTAGYGDAQNRLGGLGSAMMGGYGNTVGNIDNVRGDLRSGMDNATGNVQGLYDGSVGNWMSGKRDPMDRLLPAFDGSNYLRSQQATRNTRQAIEHQDAIREARQAGDGQAYLMNQRGEIVRGGGGYAPPGYTPLTGNEAADMLARRGPGPAKPVGERNLLGSSYSPAPGGVLLPPHPDYMTFAA